MPCLSLSLGKRASSSGKVRATEAHLPILCYDSKSMRPDRLFWSLLQSVKEPQAQCALVTVQVVTTTTRPRWPPYAPRIQRTSRPPRKLSSSVSSASRRKSPSSASFASKKSRISYKSIKKRLIKKGLSCSSNKSVEDVTWRTKRSNFRSTKSIARPISVK